MTAHTHTYPSEALDCTVCRAGLLEAFRAPADPPAAPVPSPAWNGVHAPVAYVDDHADRPGGDWRATCPCGWRKEGQYVRDGIARLTAERLAHGWARRHRENPLEDPS